MEALETKGMAAGLDATPEGREVYRGLRFRDLSGLTRWFSDGVGPEDVGVVPTRCRSMSDVDFEFVARYDLEVFGGDHRRVLAALQSRCPDLALVSGEVGAIDGFGFGRDGDFATHVELVIARSDAVARGLIEAAVARIRGAVIVDLADRHTGVARRLETKGFVASRSFTRMVRSGEEFGIDEAVFVVAGPELG